jgi:predicted ribosomally synthesized peptide with nif11-like leader
MSEEQLKAFLEAVKADAALRAKLNAAANPEAVAAIAKEAGFALYTDHMEKLRLEIADEELAGIAGGAECPSPPQTGQTRPIVNLF